VQKCREGDDGGEIIATLPAAPHPDQREADTLQYLDLHIDLTPLLVLDVSNLWCEGYTLPKLHSTFPSLTSLTLINNSHDCTASLVRASALKELHLCHYELQMTESGFDMLTQANRQSIHSLHAIIIGCHHWPP
jgi:hypothetical protein